MLRTSIMHFWGVFTICYMGYLIANAQKPLRIEGKITNLQPTLLVLQQHFGGQLVPIDTTASNLEGKFVFTEKDSVLAGLFRITGLGRGLDIAISESWEFTIEADARDVVGTIRFQNSPENDFLFHYQRQVRARFQSLRLYRQQMNIKDDNDSRWKSRFEDFTQRIKTFTDSLYAQHPQRFAARFLKTFQEPKMPVLPIRKLTAKDSLYLKAHAWKNAFENAFLGDERMLYTSSVPTRIDRFVKNIPPLAIEELKQGVDKAIGQTNGTIEMRKYLIGQLALQLETSSSDTLDALYTHIVKTYVEADPKLWDASTLQKVREMREVRELLAVGKSFPNLNLINTEGKPQPLNQVEAEHTLLFFYDPGCSHCRDTAPKLTEFAQKNPNAVKVYAVSLENNEDVWKQFIKDFQTNSFINVRDPNRKTNFNQLGVWKYPTMYLLDRNKRMVVRWPTVQQLERYFKR